MINRVLTIASCLVTVVASAQALHAQRDTSGTHEIQAHGDSVTVRLVDVDLRAAVEVLAPYLDHPVVFGAVPPSRVTVETPHPVARGEVLRLTRGMVESQNLEFVLDTSTGTYRVKSRDAPPPLQSPSGQASNGAQAGSSGSGALEFHVINLQHARAADVAATVNALYGHASALGEGEAKQNAGASPNGGAAPTLAQQLAAKQLNVNATTGGDGGAGSSGNGATLSGETTIVPDPGTNSLFIRANRGDYELIAAAVAKLDVRPLQVLVEVVIAEVSKNSSFALGLGDSVKMEPVSGLKGTSAGGSVAGLGLGDFVLNVMHTGSPAFAATLAIAAQKGDARILSRPVVLASNNQTAEIMVGSQEPFIQVAQTQVGTVAQNQVVQYEDVGTKLSVRPTISADGYVSLEVTQEVNQVTGEQQFNAPVISTRSVKTQLLVRDGQTVVLGGLSDKEKVTNHEGIPFLSSLPLIGGLFGQTSRTTTETEFFLFLTPHVIDNDAAADSLTTHMRKEAGR